MLKRCRMYRDGSGIYSKRSRVRRWSSSPDVRLCGWAGGLELFGCGILLDVLCEPRTLHLKVLFPRLLRKQHPTFGKEGKYAQEAGRHEEEGEARGGRVSRLQAAKCMVLPTPIPLEIRMSRSFKLGGGLCPEAARKRWWCREQSIIQVKSRVT